MSSKILVLNGKRRAYINPSDLDSALSRGFREPKIGDNIEGLTVVPIEKEKKQPKKKEQIPIEENSSENLEIIL